MTLARPGKTRPVVHVRVELASRLEDGVEPQDGKVTPRALARLVAMVAEKQVSVGAADTKASRL